MEQQIYKEKYNSILDCISVDMAVRTWKKMMKDDFKIKCNEKNDEWYVIKVKDEMTKNHREAEQIVSGIMPENKNRPHVSCAVI